MSAYLPPAHTSKSMPGLQKGPEAVPPRTQDTKGPQCPSWPRNTSPCPDQLALIAWIYGAQNFDVFRRASGGRCVIMTRSLILRLLLPFRRLIYIVVDIYIDK
jgi:hypothetical protein